MEKQRPNIAGKRLPRTVWHVDLLLARMEELHSDSSSGAALHTSPPQQALHDSAKQNGRERLLAVWLYLHHNFSPKELAKNPEKLRIYLRSGDRLITLLSGPGDRDLIQQIEHGMAAARAANAEGGHVG